MCSINYTQFKTRRKRFLFKLFIFLKVSILNNRIIDTMKKMVILQFTLYTVRVHSSSRGWEAKSEMTECPFRVTRIVEPVCRVTSYSGLSTVAVLGFSHAVVIH